MTFTFLYVTCSDEEEAKKIARILLEKKLIACANLFPINSIYKWKRKISDDKETAMILKTTKEKSEEVKEEIERVHSYDIPCITEIDVRPNEKYGEWLQEQLS